MYPDKQWYVLVNDDAYLFDGNLARLMRNYDESAPIVDGGILFYDYHCGGTVNWGDHPFVHAGGGIFMSRAAMEAFVKTNTYVCMEKNKFCAAGDVVLTRCLQDAGVQIAGRKETIGELFRIGNMYCDGWHGKPSDKPITYHHLTKDQMWLLYKLELEHREQPARKGLSQTGWMRGYLRKSLLRICGGSLRLSNTLAQSPRKT